MKPLFVSDLAKRVGERVTLHGWVGGVRQSRTMQFVSVRDRSGSIQVTHRRSEDAGAAETIAQLVPESAVRVTGTVRRNEGSRRHGEVEIALEALEVLAEAGAPLPLDARATPEARLDYRYLDLRSPERFLIFEVQTTFEAALRELLLEQGFVEIHSPKITAGGSESGAGVFEVPYFGNTAYLIQSTQFYKQMAMAAGFDRVFEIGPIFRAERSNTNRHTTEFTCIDFELSWIDGCEDLMELEEELLRHGLAAVRDAHGRDIERVFGVSVEVPEQPVPRVSLAFARELAREAASATQDTGEGFSHRAEQALSRYARETTGQSFVFVTDYPASERPFYHMRHEAGAGGEPPLTRSFDLLWRGIEITTGAQREHRYPVLRAQAEEAGLDEDILSGYLEPYYLEMFRWGCPPHGGFGIGLNRFLMALLAQPSVRETTFVFRGPTRWVP